MFINVLKYNIFHIEYITLYMHTYMHMNTHSYIYIYIYIYMCVYGRQKKTKYDILFLSHFEG